MNFKAQKRLTNAGVKDLDIEILKLPDSLYKLLKSLDNLDRLKMRQSKRRKRQSSRTKSIITMHYVINGQIQAASHAMGLYNRLLLAVSFRST